MSVEAIEDVTEAVRWWREALGPGVPIVLVKELQRAKKQLASTPWAGVSITKSPGGRRRKLSLLESRYLLFYEVDDAAQEVWVLRIWHMSRGRKPRLMVTRPSR